MSLGKKRKNKLQTIKQGVKICCCILIEENLLGQLILKLCRALSHSS